MPRKETVRIGSIVMVSDTKHPQYSQYASVRSYDKLRDMLSLRLDPTMSMTPVIFELDPDAVILASTSQPSFTAAHQGDSVIVINTRNPLYGEQGVVTQLTVAQKGLIYSVKHAVTGALLQFYADELSPIATTQVFLSGHGGIPNMGVISRQQAAQQHHASQYVGFSVGDWIEVTATQSRYYRLVGQVTAITQKGNLMLDVGLAHDVEVNPGNVSAYMPTAVAVDPAKGDDSDSFGVGQPKEKIFDHASLGTDLSGDELMKSIRDICGGH